MLRHVAAVAIAIALAPASVFAQQPVRLTVNAQSVDVHKFASIGSPVIGKASRGMVLVVTRELGSWVRVNWPGGEERQAFVHVSAGQITRGDAAIAGRTAAASPARPSSGATAPRTTQAPTGTRTPITVRRTPVEQPRDLYVSTANHSIGIGGRAGYAGMGYGASVRAWGKQRLGFQVALSRSEMLGPIVPERLTSVQIEPSVLFAPRDRVGDYFWMRPYAGSGVSLRQETLHVAVAGATTPVSENDLGLQGFGGAEFTFAGMPKFALSADLSYRWSRTPVVGYDMGGIGLAVSGHWYIK
jgi:hypothetical protein